MNHTNSIFIYCFRSAVPDEVINLIRQSEDNTEEDEDNGGDGDKSEIIGDKKMLG